MTTARKPPQPHVVLSRSSAIQQGLFDLCIFLVSLFILTVITYSSIQSALSAKTDDNLRESMRVFIQQSSNGAMMTCDTTLETLDQASLGKALCIVFPKNELTLSRNRIFQKTGYSTQAMGQTHKLRVSYRLLVMHRAERVFVVAENNDNDQDILKMIISSFVIKGLIALTLTVLLVIYLANRSSRQIARIEHVLRHAAQGDLKQRIGPTDKNNDLAHVSAQIDEMLSRLETSVLAMTDISANIAHELKTPISRLRHDLITALDQAEQGQNAVAVLNDAYEESSYITETFDALLRIAQIEGGARRANFADLDLNNLIKSVVDIYDEVAKDSGMTLAFITNPENFEQPVLINGDKELLVQMLANLIENSIRYCPKGTAISIACLVDSEQVKLSVSDNGLGIPLEDRENVFQRLYRGDKSRTDKRGTGLGLSLVKAIVELHRAEIELVDNEPGVRVEMRFL